MDAGSRAAPLDVVDADADADADAAGSVTRQTLASMAV